MREDELVKLKRRLVLEGDGDVILPAPLVLALVRDAEEALEARRALEAYRSSVDALAADDGGSV